MKNTEVVEIYYDKVQVTESYAPITVNIICHTEGDPDGLYWVWEIDEHELAEYFGYAEPEVLYAIHNEEMLFGDAEQFVNDEDNYEPNDNYESGTGPVLGEWYAPLTMEQIERTFGL